MKALYLDLTAPIRLALYDIRAPLLSFYTNRKLERLPLPDNARIMHRNHDGGTFIVFNESTSQLQIDSFKENLGRKLKPPTWAFWRTPRLWHVKGVPFLEDMNRFPDRFLYVNAPDYTIEQIYTLLRPFGSIHDIVSDSKDRDYTVIFNHTRDAAAARNCLHGYSRSSEGQPLNIKYRQILHSHVLWSWIQSHPRIVLPALAVLLATLSYVIFDPIRSKFVEAKISGNFNPEKYSLFRWVKNEAITRFGFSLDQAQDDDDTPGIESQRKHAVNQLESWLGDQPDTFLTITGPKGSGKNAVVSSALLHHQNVLNIDSNMLAKYASTEARLVAELASQIGYKPHFAFLSTVNNWIDLASVGIIGQKAGFQESLEAQLQQVLGVCTQALKSISECAAHHREKAQGRHKILQTLTDNNESLVPSKDELSDIIKTHRIHDGRLDAVAGNGCISELGGGVETSDSMWEIVGPRSSSILHDVFKYSIEKQNKKDNNDGKLEEDQNEFPVVVLQGFVPKNGQNETLLWDSLIKWCATLVENKIAHVIICSDSSQIQRSLAKALPNKPLNTVTLTDAEPEVALRYVTSKLASLDSDGTNITIPSQDDPNARKAMQTLGGRQSDLELLVHKLKMGSNMQEAVEDILTKSVHEVKKNMFDYVGTGQEQDKPWTSLQAFYLVNELADKRQIGYADALTNGPFKGSEDSLRAFEQAELVTIVHDDVTGRNTIKAGKPIYNSVFQRLKQDQVFIAQQKLGINSTIKANLLAAIKADEDELVKLSQLFIPQSGKWVFTSSSHIPLEVSKRIDTLLKSLGHNQSKLDDLNKDTSTQSQILSEKDV